MNKHVSDEQSVKCSAADIRDYETGPDGSFVRTGACNLEVPGSNSAVGPDICHRGCAYTVLQALQRP